MKNQYRLPCNIAQTLNLIGDKWTLLILYSIKSGNYTYKQLFESLSGIPTNLLSARLKELEKDNLIKCTLYQNHPPRYQYELSDSGNDLNDVYNTIALWGQKHINTCQKKVSHKNCSDLIKVKYYCEKCDEYIERDEIVIQ